jgi:hypothetical protein
MILRPFDLQQSAQGGKLPKQISLGKWIIFRLMNPQGISYASDLNKPEGRKTEMNVAKK